jgi:hypothetical protein
MTLLAELTVKALLLPLAIEPMPTAPVAVESTPPAVVAPAATTVVVSEGAPTTVVAAAPSDPWATTTTTTTTTTATTTTTTTTAAPAPAPAALAPALTPKAAVRNLLRYDPYLAPRYRSGRNMMIGGGVMLGVGTFSLLSTLSYMSLQREADHNANAYDRTQVSFDRHHWVPVVRVVAIASAVVALTGVALLATGAVRRRRAIEEARGRVFMQAGPGGMQVRF